MLTCNKILRSYAFVDHFLMPMHNSIAMKFYSQLTFYYRIKTDLYSFTFTIKKNMQKYGGKEPVLTILCVFIRICVY